MTSPPRASPPSRAATGTWARLGAAAIAALCLGVLALASSLKPSPYGLGTHRQLGLMECGWMIALGKPCPTCGMTTAFAHAAHGDLASASRAQPLGAVLAVLTASAFWASVHVAATGSRLAGVCGTLLRPRVMWLVLAAAALAWAYKLYTFAGPGTH